jgi:hypothetical protein
LKELFGSVRRVLNPAAFGESAVPNAIVLGVEALDTSHLDLIRWKENPSGKHIRIKSTRKAILILHVCIGQRNCDVSPHRRPAGEVRSVRKANSCLYVIYANTPKIQLIVAHFLFTGLGTTRATSKHFDIFPNAVGIATKVAQLNASTVFARVTDCLALSASPDSSIHSASLAVGNRNYSVG